MTGVQTCALPISFVCVCAGGLLVVTTSVMVGFVAVVVLVFCNLAGVEIAEGVFLSASGTGLLMPWFATEFVVNGLVSAGDAFVFFGRASVVVLSVRVLWADAFVAAITLLSAGGKTDLSAMGRGGVSVSRRVGGVGGWCDSSIPGFSASNLSI